MSANSGDALTEFAEHGGMFPRIVTWIDSCVQNDQVDKDDFPKPCTVKSFGFVVEETHEYVTLARDDVGDGDYRGLISIPRIAITETKP